MTIEEFSLAPKSELLRIDMKGTIGTIAHPSNRDLHLLVASKVWRRCLLGVGEAET